MDLLITGGLVIDGSGNPGFYGAVGVEGERVRVLRGDVSGVQAPRVLDASGKVVCPGFIDVHAHSGLMILTDPAHEAKVHQGVTTELVGVDGNSYAPFRSRDDLLRFVRLNSGLDGAPDLPGWWSSTSEYLEMFDGKVAVNIAYIVGNSPLRIDAVGWESGTATQPQKDRMRSLLREAMEEGAFGLSTGLDYPPGGYADTDELVDLASEAAAMGGIYHTHMRYRLGDRYLDPVHEAIEIGKRSGIPLHITHLFRRVTNPGGARRLLDLVDGARAGGLDVTFDCFPYPYGGTRILILFPDWAHEGGPDRLVEVLRSPEARARLRKEVAPRGRSWDEMWVTYFQQPHNMVYDGRSIAEVAEMMGKHPVDALCDLLLEEDLRVSYFSLVSDPATIADFVAHPLQMVGSDALLIGGHPPPMAYGCFPVILGEMVREERRLSLADALRKMTSFPAQRLGIRDRGVLRDGAFADIVVFDPDTINANATRQEPRQPSTGIEYVLVNGQLVMDRGRHTGALAGRALRRGRS
ncbi:MAG: D-aminoacylase [Dehalococcoidia bacterium]|nr:D-aminoacylase [Dehalococcoidia bacterium]